MGIYSSQGRRILSTKTNLRITSNPQIFIDDPMSDKQAKQAISNLLTSDLYCVQAHKAVSYGMVCKHLA
jgi:hypothetical protein